MDELVAEGHLLGGENHARDLVEHGEEDRRVRYSDLLYHRQQTLERNFVQLVEGKR